MTILDIDSHMLPSTRKLPYTNKQGFCFLVLSQASFPTQSCFHKIPLQQAISRTNLCFSKAAILYTFTQEQVSWNSAKLFHHDDVYLEVSTSEFSETFCPQSIHI